MARQKISIKRRKYAKSGSMTKLKKQPREYDSMKELLDEELISKAVWECLKDNDPDGVIEILEAHLRAKNKSKLAREHDLPRTTFYHAFKSKNPTLHTLAKLVHATA
jgi:probable addiction module antidote protein